jgi:hypothetical protein
LGSGEWGYFEIRKGHQYLILVPGEITTPCQLFDYNEESPMLSRTIEQDRCTVNGEGSEYKWALALFKGNVSVFLQPSTFENGGWEYFVADKDGFH